MPLPHAFVPTAKEDYASPYTLKYLLHVSLVSALLCKMCETSTLHNLLMVLAHGSSSQVDITGDVHLVMDCFKMLDARD